MSNRALIFFDIDGTLLDDNKKLPKSTRKAIEQLQAKGHIIAIATGRGPFMYLPLRKELNILTFISFNGSYVVINDEVVFTNPLDNKRLSELTTEGLAKDQPAVFMTKEALHSNVDRHSSIDKSLATLKLEITPSFDSQFNHDQEVFQTLFFIEEDAEQYYRDKYPEFDFVRWHPLSVDVIPKGGSKAKGIDTVVEALNIDPDNVYAFGDGLNDVEMLQTVKNSVAMGNSVPEAKDAAKFVTKTVDQNGVIHGLKMVGLLP